MSFGFLRGRWDQGAAFLTEFENLAGWEETGPRSGPRNPNRYDARRGRLPVPPRAEPAHAKGVAEGDPQGLTVGGQRGDQT